MAISARRRQRRGSRAITRDIQNVDLSQREESSDLGYRTFSQVMTAPRTPEIDRQTRELIEYIQRYFNQLYDNITRSVGFTQITVPDDNPIPLNDRIDNLTGTYNDIDRSRVPEWVSSANVNGNRPNINHRLSAKVVDAGGSDITFHILMTAYQECIPMTLLIEPNGLWAHPHMYVRVREFITSQPEFARTVMDGVLTGIRFMAANLHRDDSIPPDEILLFNSRYPEHSARIVNLSQEFPNVNR